MTSTNTLKENLKKNIESHWSFKDYDHLVSIKKEYWDGVSPLAEMKEYAFVTGLFHVQGWEEVHFYPTCVDGVFQQCYWVSGEGIEHEVEYTVLTQYDVDCYQEQSENLMEEDEARKELKIWC